MESTQSQDLQGLMDVEAVQRVLHRSRASVYRYANTDLHELNPPYDPKRLNAEYRRTLGEPLLFHPNEVARFAQDVLAMRPVTITVQEIPRDVTQTLLQEILTELQEIRQLLASRP